MKKIISILFLLIITTISIQAGVIKDNIQGVWGDSTINFTFEGDSLYIDEIGNEGFCYTFKEIPNKDVLQVHNTFDNFEIIIKSLDKTTLVCYINEYPYKEITLTRKQHNEYDK